MYLISVYFDDKANRILQRYIDQIAERTGNAFMTEKNVPPHMTISSIEARSVDVLIPAFESLHGKLTFKIANMIFEKTGYNQQAANSYVKQNESDYSISA